VLAVRTDHMLKTLKHARLDNSYEAEFRKLLGVDLLILDDFALDTLDPTESRDLYEILLERHRAGSIIVTSNRGPDEWLVTFADPIRAQSAIDRFTSNAYDLVIDGETYRKRQKPTLDTPPLSSATKGRTRNR
jgi:DNA replication protein DnaC